MGLLSKFHSEKLNKRQITFYRARNAMNIPKYFAKSITIAGQIPKFYLGFMQILIVLVKTEKRNN